MRRVRSARSSAGLTTAALLIVVLVLAGCSGKTTGTSKVAQNSATLNIQGSCESGEPCQWYYEYWRADRPRSTSTKTPVLGPVNGPIDPVALHADVTGLEANTTYRWVTCGSPNGGTWFVCVGPKGTGKGFSTAVDPPPSFETFTTPVATRDAVSVTGRGTTSGPDDFNVEVSSDSSGANPTGTAATTGSLRGHSATFGGPVTCLVVTGHTARLNYTGAAYSNVGTMVIRDNGGGGTDSVTLYNKASMQASDCTSALDEDGSFGTTTLDRGRAVVTDAR